MKNCTSVGFEVPILNHTPITPYHDPRLLDSSGYRLRRRKNRDRTAPKCWSNYIFLPLPIWGMRLHSANLRLRRSIITVLVSLEGNCSTIWQTDDFPIQCYQSDIETVLVSIISIQCLCIFDTYLPMTGFLPRHHTTTDRVGLRNPIDILKSQLTPSFPHFRPQFRPVPVTGPPF